MARNSKRPLGELMVDEGIVTSEQLANALTEQDRTGRPLGEILVGLGFASAGAVANALAEQHGGLLKTEYGVSAGLRTVTDAGLANAPLRHLLPTSDGLGAADGVEPVGLRVVAMSPPAGDGPPVAPQPTVVAPDGPDQIPNAHELRIADLSSRLDETMGKLHVSQQARDAFAKRASDLETQLASAAPADGAHQADSAQVARIEQLEAHIQQLDAHIQAAAIDRENIVQHYTGLQGKLAAAEAAAPEADPAQAAKIEELEAQLEAAAVDRQGLAASLTELEARLAETAHPRDVERNDASAGAAARVSVLERKRQAVSDERDAMLAAEKARAEETRAVTEEAQARIAELEVQLQQAELESAALESESSDAPDPARVAELQAVSDERKTLAVAEQARAEDAQSATEEALARIAELEL